jgi:hypothetical protein
MSGEGGIEGNRAVPPPLLLGPGGDLGAAGAEAIPVEEGGSWGEHGFPHGSSPKASDDHATSRRISSNSARLASESESSDG